MAHRCLHLCFTSQLWLPYLAFCFDPPGCFWGLHIWSRIVGSKSSKLQYMLQIMTALDYMCLWNWACCLMIIVVYCLTFILFPSCSHTKEKGKRQIVSLFGNQHLPKSQLLPIELIPQGFGIWPKPKKGHGVLDFQK